MTNVMRYMIILVSHVIAFVNVCVLHSKNNNPELQDFIENYDVFNV